MKCLAFDRSWGSRQSYSVIGPFPASFKWKLAVTKNAHDRAVVVAQLAARSIPNLVDPGSSPVTCNFYFLLTVYRKDKNKEKEAGNGPLKNIFFRNDRYLGRLQQRRPKIDVFLRRVRRLQSLEGRLHQIKRWRSFRRRRRRQRRQFRTTNFSNFVRNKLRRKVSRMRHRHDVK